MIRDRKRSTYLRCIKAGRRCNFFLNGSLSHHRSGFFSRLLGSKTQRELKPIRIRIGTK